MDVSKEENKKINFNGNVYYWLFYLIYKIGFNFQFKNDKSIF